MQNIEISEIRHSSSFKFVDAIVILIIVHYVMIGKTYFPGEQHKEAHIPGLGYVIILTRGYWSKSLALVFGDLLEDILKREYMAFRCEQNDCFTLWVLHARKITV